MRAFPDQLETVLAAASNTTARSLTTSANVKTALKIADAASDTLIDALIPRVSALVVSWCRLAADDAGSVPTFGRETLRATWQASCHGRGCDLWLPWRLPVSSIDSVTEDGTALTVTTDYVRVGARPGRLRRVSDGEPTYWSPAKIIVEFKAGFASPAADNVDATIEAAVIEQIKAMLLGADRDPAIRSVSSPDVASETYSVTGGDVMGASVLLPTVRDMLAPWRNPAP